MAVGVTDNNHVTGFLWNTFDPSMLTENTHMEFPLHVVADAPSEGNAATQLA